MFNIDSLEIEFPKSTDIATGSRDGGITIIYHKNGKRIVFSKRILSLLGNPEKVKFGFVNDYLIVLPTDDTDGFTLKDMSNQKVIYNAPLILEILEYFKINYENNFCKTFSDVEEVEGRANTIALKISR